MHCCARCGRQVYHAEQKVALNKYWHSFCFSCYKCRKILDSCSVNTHNGELFCNSCYKCVCCDPCFPFKPCRPQKKCCPVKNCKSINKDCCKKTCESVCKSKPGCTCCACMPSAQDCCDPCCSPIVFCTPKPCQRCEIKSYCQPDFVNCNPPCKPIRVKTRSVHKICCCPGETLCLQPACPRKNCVPVAVCLESCEPPTLMSRCRSCSPGCSEPVPCRTPCCPQRPVSACAAPAPRETSSYYSRNHNKCIENNCMGGCYCPEDCCCPNKRNANQCHASRNSDPCVIIEPCPPKKCWPPKQCCPPPNCVGQSNCCNPNITCLPCPPKCPPEPECPPCHLPYQPPPRKAVCYPPVKCCEKPPPERICYYPGESPPLPKCCPCGTPNPCNCDLNYRRRLAITSNTPCCRRCGRKVYAAERIVTAGSAFHSCCFSCYCCHKSLEVTNVYENQGEIYCRSCYCKFFGIQGYGYGSTLQTPL